MAFAFSDIVSWTGGHVQAVLPGVCNGVTQDTRALQPGNLYVALRGERLDGHRFVAQALAQGASAALVAEDWPVPPDLADAPLIRVPDPLSALSEMARAWRAACATRIIGLTGSSGKTTTKEMTAALLAADGRKVCATKGNLNNAIGLPLSLLSLTPYAAFGVFETGTNHFGEIAHLARILQPDAAILTNIGTAHIEHFKTQAGIAQEKGTLFEVLPADGFAVLPLETVCFDALAARTRARIVTVSLQSAVADYAGRCLDVAAGRVAVTERKTGETVELTCGLPGEHNILDMLLAYAAAREMGIPGEACPPALRDFRLPGMRWSVTERDGVTFINDAYNANPQSMAAVLKTLASYPCSGRRVAVLGDMLELGDQAEPLHREIGRQAAGIGLDLLITVGPLSRAHLADEARKAGFAPERIVSFTDTAEAKPLFRTLLRPTDTVLLKASHGIGLEQLL